MFNQPADIRDKNSESEWDYIEQAGWWKKHSSSYPGAVIPEIPTQEELSGICTKLVGIPAPAQAQAEVGQGRRRWGRDRDRR